MQPRVEQWKCDVQNGEGHVLNGMDAFIYQGVPKCSIPPLFSLPQLREAQVLPGIMWNSAVHLSNLQENGYAGLFSTNREM